MNSTVKTGLAVIAAAGICIFLLASFYPTKPIKPTTPTSGQVVETFEYLAFMNTNEVLLEIDTCLKVNSEIAYTKDTLVLTVNGAGGAKSFGFKPLYADQEALTLLDVRKDTVYMIKLAEKHTKTPSLLIFPAQSDPILLLNAPCHVLDLN